MVWLFVLGLVVWLLVLQSQLDTLRRQLEALQLRLPAQNLAPKAEPARDEGMDARAIVEASVAPTPPAPPWAEPALIPKPVPEPVAPVVSRPDPAPLPIEPLAAQPSPPAEPTPRPAPAPHAPGPSISDWLSENGLAWIGGGALALGGLLLVAYAAQRGLFAPPFRIAAASLVGFLALGAGEALRRGLGARLSPNLLVAGLTTGAGAAILCAATWASYQLYGFIGPVPAAALLAAISLGLLALALLHGEALAVLAIAAAFAVPPISGVGHWTAAPLDAFPLLILTTGLAASGLRRWAIAGVISLAGAGAWALARQGAGDDAGVALLAGAAPALTIAAAIVGRVRFRVPRSAAAPAGLFDALPTIAVIGASVIAANRWAMLIFISTPIAMHQILLYGTVLTVASVLAVAAGARAGVARSWLLLAPAIVTVLAALCLDSTTVQGAAVLAVPACVAMLAVAGLLGAWRLDQPAEHRRTSAVIGAAGAALSMTFLAPALAHALPRWDGTLDAAFALALASGAILFSRHGEAGRSDLTTAAWIAGATELAGLALHASLDMRVLPAAYGLLGLVLAGLAMRVRWRGFAETAAVACLASFAALLSPALAGAVAAGGQTWLLIAAASAAACLAQGAAWFTLRPREDVDGPTEAISTLIVMTALLGAFLVIQTLGAAKGGLGLDDFSRASLRTLLLLAAGLMLSIRGAATPLGRARAPVFLALGALHGVFLQAISLHPWWGAGGAVSGPPVFDSVMLGLLAPAALLVEATRRLGAKSRVMAGSAFATAMIFLVVWIASELRRLFHGPMLTVGDFGYAEVAAYGAAILALAVALEGARARLGALLMSRKVLSDVLNVASWFAVLVALWLLAIGASPWWGPLDGDLRQPLLLFALYAATFGLGAGLALMARRSERRALAHTALVSAGVVLFALLTLVIRYAFHGGAMRAALREASLETWTFSAVWALYGLAALAIGAARKDAPLRWLGLAVLLGTTAKVFLFDMATLEGVVRAASFLALGVVLLIGALAARRFGSGDRSKGVVEDDPQRVTPP
jgi:hypothetical protein